jgi:hypothetical protein
MALKAIISASAHDELGESIQPEYAKGDDGRFYLSVDPVDGYRLEDVSGLRSALERERENARTAKASVDAFGDLTPDAARAAIAKAEKLSGDISETDKFRDAIAAREAQFVEKHTAEITSEKEKSGQLMGQLERHLIDAAATAAINASKGNVRLLLPHVRGAVRMIEGPHGDYVAQVVDPATGVPKVTLKPGSQDPMSVAELVDTMKGSDDFGSAFAGSGNRGLGTHSDDGQGGRSGGSPRTISRSDQDAIDSNFEKIASGEVTVVD